MKKNLIFGAITVLFIQGMASLGLACNGPIKCAIKTYTGHYVTAVGGGGRLTDVIHTNAIRVGSWERFTFVDSCDGGSVISYGLRTVKGYYLTAVGGGGRITDVIHSDATQLQGWEKFKAISLGNGVYALQTLTGNYVTAVGGGGRITDTIHTDATQIGNWEKFRLECEP
ncbi:fascin domain-containing protein [Bdellovibrio sp. HCB274]|uniref:fascin domain-containing protein n=1 Tax=Bdellovibrio sp. HCB274 TaxID=3394361 RepID=UPI0039B38561